MVGDLVLMGVMKLTEEKSLFSIRLYRKDNSHQIYVCNIYQ
jgi:hypothetical protein